MIDEKEFLSKYEKTFGKGADWFKVASIVRICEKKNTSLVAADASSEELLRMEEAFERMAFEAAEERDLLKYVFVHGFDTCDCCVNRIYAEEPDYGCDCLRCGKEYCPCFDCNVKGADEHFVLDAEFVKSKMGKAEGK